MLDLATTYPNISALVTTLMQAGVPAHESWWLLEKLFQQTRAELLLASEIVLSATQLAQLQDWLVQLLIARQPLQYLLGSVPFLNLELLVAPPTLIPRPETEAWCARLIAELPTTPQRILELCTGTGCLGLAVAHARPASQVQALDIAPAACALAEQNRQRLGLANFTIIQSDLWQNVPALPYDVLIANPPYITTAEYTELAPQLRLWEDTAALVAGEDGLAVLRPLIQGAAVRAIPKVYLEIGATQASAVSQLLQAAGYQTQVWQDQYGRDRVVVGSLTKLLQSVIKLG